MLCTGDKMGRWARKKYFLGRIRMWNEDLLECTPNRPNPLYQWQQIYGPNREKFMKLFTIFLGIIYSVFIWQCCMHDLAITEIRNNNTEPKLNWTELITEIRDVGCKNERVNTYERAAYVTCDRIDTPNANEIAMCYSHWNVSFAISRDEIVIFKHRYTL